jgi:8-oxo-dGTP pyrophosphatase MutT (NUDIX family)
LDAHASQDWTVRFFFARNWRAWLAKNHRTAREIWLIYDKKFAQTRLISYRDFLNQAVEEAICYGWIDSRVKRIGETKLGARFTPRRSRDNWSKYNKARALKLLRDSRMTKAGKAVLPVEWTNKRLERDLVQRRAVENLAAGILMKGREFLVEKRRDDEEADPGYVEIPGGHVEKDETLEDALRREMMEELGIRVERAKLVHEGVYTATNGERGKIHYFHVEKWTGKIVSKEAQRVYWESDLSNLSTMPDRKAVRRVLIAQNSRGDS